MEFKTRNFTSLCVICIVIIAIGAFLNLFFFPLNFSIYFLICALSLLSCKFIGDKSSLVLPWSITAAASVIITLNYLHPDISVYSNADYHTLVMQGVEKKDSVLLIGKNKTESFFDRENLEGYLSITPQGDNMNCIMHYDLQGEPLFIVVEGERTGKLINKGQLPHFRNNLTIENDSIQCCITITDFQGDSIHVDVSFNHQASNPNPSQRPSFKQPIHIGYNIYDLLHSGISYLESEEKLLDALRNTVIVRDYDEKDVYYMTYPRSMESLRLVCDGKPFLQEKGMQTKEIDKNDYFYLGIGSQATRPMKASYESGSVCLRFRFPYVNNFPGALDGTDVTENEQKILAVTTKTASLLKANANEAFYYPLFENEDNEYNFNGNINYRINNSQVPFKATLTDDHQNTRPAPNTLTSKNGAVWHFNVCDMRQNSPVTGKENIYVQDRTIISMVFIMLLFAFICPMLLTRKDTTAQAMMMAWLFAIPLLVMRIYLLWRIAVFPPVSNITLNEFLRYRMELSNLTENPMIITAFLLIVPLVILIVYWVISIIVPFIVLFFKLLPSPILRIFHNLRRITAGHWTKVFIFIIVFCVYGATIIIRAHINTVGLNILAPVLAFLINEYIVTRWLTVGFRIVNAISVLIALFFCDPGYAIMFFIFECIYYTIILYAFLIYRWRYTSSAKAVGSYFFVILLIVLMAVSILLPNIISFSYSSTSSLGFISNSRLFFILFPIITGGILLFITWRWKEQKSRCYLVGYAILSLIVIGATVLSPIYVHKYYHTHNLHFKYRAIIHTQTVGEIMQDERYGDDDAQRLLNAAQNQWFLQYHINKGGERITEDGIISLSPHFKKGVTWNTQISDVILSRYVIGELSGLVPLFMILLAGVFLWAVFHRERENDSPAGHALTFAIALLFLVQSTFEWMAVTNRTIFFGQDFPFLSQNARCTLIMFEIWLILFVYFACHDSRNEDNDGLRKGLTLFTKPSRQSFFFGLFALLVGIIYFCGNKYEKLYANESSEGNRSNAEEFNLSTAMNESSRQLADINDILSEYPARDKRLENNEDLSSLVQDIEDKIQLSQHVENLKKEGRINDFTYSLYLAFTKNLKRKNSNGNIIHLRHHNTHRYELALNRSYFNLQSPDLDKKAWKGNVYSNVSSPIRNKTSVYTNLPGIAIYSVPRSWIPSDIDYAIADCRTVSGENYERIIHKDMADYTAPTTMAVFPILSKDFLELKNKKNNDILTYQYGREEKNLLVKNITLNGKRKFFYPLKENCLWLRDFSNLVAYSKQGSGSKDSVFVTLDNILTENLSDSLKKTGCECSVVAMDGWGNVRLMIDNKKSGTIDPNNESLLNEIAIQSYLNPNPETDQNLFGNLNLCYMKPGPGSSLKPITYAAVTSQSQDINWADLELMSPALLDTAVSKPVGKYYNLQQYGPSYKYSVRRPFKSLQGDEKGINGWIDNDFYLYKSSNYYNALITYLGHYDNLADAKDSIFVISTNVNDYPRFKIEKGGKMYTFRDAPHAIANHILLDGLTKNFRMPTFTGYIDTIRYEFVNPAYYKQNNLESKSWLSNRFPWAFPQASSIYDYEMKEPEMTPAERLRQYTLGAFPVKVTPIKMAEMYGQLYSMHPDFHASVTPHESSFTEPWLDRNGLASKDFIDFYRDNLFRGMAACATIGTASFLGETIKGYHLYAKTGTLSLRAGVNDDRMLAVIISNKNLIDDKDIKSSDDYKFMVVYFRFKQLDPESTLFPTTVKTTINEIVNSASFNSYMR